MNMQILIVFLKYILAISIIIVIFMAPAWLAKQTKKDKNTNGFVRLASWVFGWTIVGWLVALYLAAKK